MPKTYKYLKFKIFFATDESGDDRQNKRAPIRVSTPGSYVLDASSQSLSPEREKQTHSRESRDLGSETSKSVERNPGQETINEFDDHGITEEEALQHIDKQVRTHSNFVTIRLSNGKCSRTCMPEKYKSLTL